MNEAEICLIDYLICDGLGVAGYHRLTAVKPGRLLEDLGKGAMPAPEFLLPLGQKIKCMVRSLTVYLVRLYLDSRCASNFERQTTPKLRQL